MAGAPAIGAWPRGGRCARQLLVVGYCLLVVVRVCCERGKCAASARGKSSSVHIFKRRAITAQPQPHMKQGPRQRRLKGARMTMNELESVTVLRLC